MSPSPARLSIAIALLAVAWLAIAPTLQAQITNVTNSTSTPTPGVGHDYLGTLGETVNPANGSISIRLSVPTPKGRGLTLPFAFTYDSNSIGLMPRSDQPNELQWSSPKGVFFPGWWSYSLPQLTATVQLYQSPSYPGINPCYSTTGYMFQDPTGARHALGLSAVLSNTSHTIPPGVPSCDVANNGEAWTNFLSGGDDFYRAQINGIYAQSTYANIQNAGAGAGQVQVVDASGTVYTFGRNTYTGWNCAPGQQVSTAGGTIINATGYAMPSSIEDRNGNVITISQPCAGGGTLSISDTTGRTALSFQTSGGLGATEINSVTVSGIAQPYTVTPVTGSSGTPINVNATPTGIFPTPNNCTGVPAWSGSASNSVGAITLPNGKQYQFTYDPTYGLLSKITYPGGGYVSYTWGMNPQSALAQYTDTEAKELNDCSYRYDKPALMHRYVSFDGQTVALQQDFSYSMTWGGPGYSWSSMQTTVTTHDLVRGTSFQTIYTYSPITVSNPPNTPPNYYDSQIPVESTITYKDTNGQVLKTVTKTWSSVDEMGSELQTLDNGAMSSVCYSYGPGHTITDKKEYDFGQITSSSTPCPTTNPARETATTYKTLANTPIYPSGPSIFDRPSSIITYGNGTRVAETDYTYDQSTVGSVSNLPSGTHDETYYAASSTAPRGNATTITKQCFQGAQACASGNLATTSTFDETGQTLSTIDPNNHTTQFIYADSYTVLSNGANVTYTPTANTNTYLTKTINPLSQTQNYTYDFNTGQLTVSKDQNSLTTTYLYNDPLSRPTLTTRPDGGTTATTYNDSSYNPSTPSPSVTTTTSINGTESLVTVAAMDGLAHPVTGLITSDPQGTTHKDTAYDGLGRVYTVSNPYRSGGDPTTSSGTTTYFYDALGRKCLEVPPDGTLPSGGACPTTQPANTIFTTYSGNTTTVTDQTGKSRKSVTDSLGRMTQIFEDPAGVNYETDYGYDALNDLLCAAQKGTSSGNFTTCSSIPTGWHPRTFSYDSLARLLTSNNPEVGTITYKYDSDANCSGPNFLGLLVSKTDNRGIRTCAQYDAINRETSLSYSSGDPTITTTYDQANCLSLPACQNIGHRTSLTDAAGSESWAYQVDATNHRNVHVNQRTTSGIAKMSTYYFDLAGNVTQAVYPTARVVDYTFDNANRPIAAAVSGSNGNVYSTGSVTVGGNEQSVTTANAVAGTGSVTFSGTLQSKQVQTQAAKPGTGTVTVSGAERSKTFLAGCSPRYDGGYLAVTVNGTQVANVFYGDGTGNSCSVPSPMPTASSLATQIAAAINGSSIVSATVSGATITLTSKTAGANTNYSLSTNVSSYFVMAGFPPASFTLTPSGSTLTGGADAVYTTVYDSGTSTITVNGHGDTVSWSGSATTTSTIASALASTINADSSASVTASASGATVNLTAKTTGSGTNYSLSSSSTYDTSNFSSASFSSSNSGSTLTGGANSQIVYDTGSVSVTVNGFTASTSYGQTSNTASIAAALASGLNGSSSPVTASASGSVITLTAKAGGSAGNDPLSTSVSYDTTHFSSASFTAAPSGNTLAGGITNVTGLQNPPTGCLSGAVCYTPQGTFYALSIGQSPSFTGLNLTHTYNNRLQPLEFKASSPGGNAIDITYSFIDSVTGHNAGHVNSITNNLDTTRSQNFYYDQLNRITSALTTSTHATSPSHCWGESYTLDAWGNLNGIAATTNSNYIGCTEESGFSSIADGNNHLPAWAYDASGNATSDGVVTNYQWDAESQLKSAAGVNYLYDGDGRRVSKVGSKLYWYGSGDDILAETDASGNATAEYIFFGGKRIAMIPSTGVPPVAGNPIYYVEDLLGTSRVITTNSGVVCYDADFYPYGGERAYTNTCPQNYKFEGKERDTETGNDDFGARYYSNRFGRWLSADWSSVPVPVPYANLTNPQTLNLYAMVSDDPESFADLDGHFLTLGRNPTVYSSDSDCFGYSDWHSCFADTANSVGSQSQETADTEDQASGQQLAQGQSSTTAAPTLKGPYIADLKSPEIAPLLDPNHKPSLSDIVPPHGECVDLTKKFSGMGPFVDTSLWRPGPKVVDDKDIKPGTAIATFTSGGEKGRYPKGDAPKNSGIYLGRGTNGSIWILDQWPARPGGQKVNPPQPRELLPNQPYASNNSGAYYVILVAPR